MKLAKITGGKVENVAEFDPQRVPDWARDWVPYDEAVAVQFETEKDAENAAKKAKKLAKGAAKGSALKKLASAAKLTPDEVAALFGEAT